MVEEGVGGGEHIAARAIGWVGVIHLCCSVMLLSGWLDVWYDAR